MPHQAEALASRLPPLLVAAEQVAATVAQGVHGRRRVGTGDSFWQFRPFVTGDTASRIDWRQSAKSDRAYVRDTEWEAAQTVCLWRDASASMAWRSGRACRTSASAPSCCCWRWPRCCCAAASRCGCWACPAGCSAAAARWRRWPGRCLPADGPARPRAVPRHARVVLIGDFLCPLAEIRAACRRLAGGRCAATCSWSSTRPRWRCPMTAGCGSAGWRARPMRSCRACEGVREAYAAALAAQQAGLAALCAAAGFGFGVHRTDQPPEAALLALWMALDGGGRPVIFAAPWVLLALAALPVLWWLLRATPPAPRAQDLPRHPAAAGLRPPRRRPRARRGGCWRCACCRGPGHPRAGAAGADAGPAPAGQRPGPAGDRRRLVVRPRLRRPAGGRRRRARPAGAGEPAGRPADHGARRDGAGAAATRADAGRAAAPALAALRPKPWPTDRAGRRAPLPGRGGRCSMSPTACDRADDGVRHALPAAAGDRLRRRRPARLLRAAPRPSG